LLWFVGIDREVEEVVVTEAVFADGLASRAWVDGLDEAGANDERINGAQ
jgi:hypothetical protein